MGLTNYVDLEIQIGKLDAARGYPVEITLNGDREFPRGYLSPQLPEIDGPNAIATGEVLFAWLFGEIHLAKAWAEARGSHNQRRIRLRIDADAPELHTLPWEALRDPESGHLAAMESTPFSRYLAGPWMPGNPILKRPIRVLVAIASPINLADFDLQAIDGDREWDLIQAAVAGVPGIELIRLPDPCTLPALEAAIRKGIHILHFVSHGYFDQNKRTGSLLLADEQNRVKPAEDHEIAEMLHRQLANSESSLDDKLRLVYLSSCQTATRDSFDAFRGLAPKIVDAGVPAVVAMQDFIPVKAAEAFEQVFYRELLDHGEVDRASNAARASLLTAKIWGAAIPVLFLRLRSGQLLGKRGMIVGDVSDAYWRTLVNKIRRGQCTPILGPGVASALLPSPEELAQAISDSQYPFADGSDLRRVSQFLGTMDNADMRQRVLDQLIASLRRNLGVSNGAASITTLSDLQLDQWKGLSERFETEIHQQLAALGLPLYVTTNFDNFMTRALQLRLREEDVRRETVIWREAREERQALDPPPSAAKPVVLHLFGDDREPESMVLTEDDHLDYLARISHDQEIFLPASINALLAKNTLLFLGYRLQDLDLKVILRGLLTYLALTKYDRMQLAVQIETEQHDASTQKEVTEYLQQSFRQYFSSKSDVKVYWGSAHQFLADLTARMRELPHG